MNDAKLKSLATRALTWFTTQKRGEETITVLKNGNPKWTQELVYAAHGDFMPEDHRFGMIREVLQGLAEDGEDATFEPDIYNAQLTTWLSSSLNRIAYVDEAMEDFGGDRVSLVEQLQYGQLRELDEIKGQILNFFETTEIPKK